MPVTSAASAAHALGQTSASSPTRRAVSAAISAPCTGPQPSVERELAEHEHAPRALARQLVAGRQDRDGHREIVARAELGHVARREVDDHAPLRPPQLARDDAGAHALARLVDRAVGQADDDRGPVPAPAHAGLHLHQLALHADRRLTVGGGDHGGEATASLCYVSVTDGTRRRRSGRDGRRS